MLAVLGMFSALASCPEQPEVRVAGHARQVLQAFDAADASLLDAARAGLDRDLPCLEGSPSEATLRVLHRAMALVAYADRDNDAAARAWSALRHLDPTAQPDVRRFPRGHGVWRDFESAKGLVGEPTPLPPLGGGRWRVDGVRAREAPGERAFVWSAERRRQPTTSGYAYQPGDIPALGFETGRRRRALRAVSLTTAGVCAVAGAGLLVSAANLERDLLGGAVPADEVVSGQAIANRRYAAGGVLVGAGALLGTLSFSIRF